VPERLMKTTIYSPIEETFYASGVKEIDANGEEVESLPTSLIPQSTTYKVDVYWWGLRDVNITRKPCAVLQIDELTIKSDIICDKKPNCNFPNGRISQTFEGPLNEAYRSNLAVKLYDSGTFGRTMFLGTNVMKNPNKYIVNWIAKSEREASLKSASITSSNFLQEKNQFIRWQATGGQGHRLRNLRTMRAVLRITHGVWNWSPTFVSSSGGRLLTCPYHRRRLSCNLAGIGLTLKDYETEDKANLSEKITIYSSELERQPEFSKFKDWCSALKFYNGMKSGIPEKDEQLYCGFLKVGIAMYKWPPPSDTVAVSPSGVELNNGYFDDMPSNDPTQFLVRVYLVKGMDLKTKDFTGQSDPYVVLNCGKKRMGNREEFVKNTVNPIFGRMYEFRCTIPEDYRLKVSLYDYEAIQPDELIGSTEIDLEDRIYTKHRARIGLSSEYNLTGPYKWRDSMKPSEILEELCLKNHLALPVYPDMNTVILNGVEYKDSEKDKAYISTSERKENICLSLLHKWHTMPLCGYHLVPEHVETRILSNPEKTGVEQGKIVMWVDMFPLDTELYIPPPVDITPRSVEEYELRLTVWDAQNLKLDDGSTTNKKAPDIYVKAWIGSTSQAQDTDIHYRCTNGEGNFNWRMVFNFQYQHVERKIVVKEKGPFTEYEERVPPVLVVQVMDSEAVLADDFLGTLTLDLNALPRGEKLARQCTLEAMEKAKKMNLFSMRSIRCWWPLWTIDSNTDKKTLAGVIDIEMTLLPKEKAVLMPVGLGRSSPNPLPEPKRPSLSSIIMNKLWSPDESLQLTMKVVAILIILVLLLLAAIYFDVMPDIGFQKWTRFVFRKTEKRIKREYPTKMMRSYQIS
ncbi:otoferlin-like, partial [Ostrinia furnacalis]|uniref:otoferlin-like n=1 Tax=Ostrinia furnacalis TaxID=93504 RepID=UPI0010407A9D